MKYWNRKINVDVTDTEVASSSSSLPASPVFEFGGNHSRSQSVILPQTHSTSTPDSLRRVRSEHVYGHEGSALGFTSPDVNGPNPCRRSDAEGSSDEWDGTSRRSHQNSVLSSCSSSGISDAALVTCTEPEVNESELESSSVPRAKENFHLLSPPSVLVCAKLLFVI